MRAFCCALRSRLGKTIHWFVLESKWFQVLKEKSKCGVDFPVPLLLTCLLQEIGNTVKWENRPILRLGRGDAGCAAWPPQRCPAGPWPLWELPRTSPQCPCLLGDPQLPPCLALQGRKSSKTQTHRVVCCRLALRPPNGSVGWLYLFGFCFLAVSAHRKEALSSVGPRISRAQERH